MKSLQENMLEYKKQLQKGAIQKAYQGLMEYMQGLKNHFANQYPHYAVPANIYYGDMDVTYFSIIPASLKARELKIVIAFLYDPFRFEIWLSGKNKQVLKKYWEIIRQNHWDQYKTVPPEKGVYFIVEHVLADNPDFDNLEVLTQQIEQETVKFIGAIESLLAQAEA